MSGQLAAGNIDLSHRPRVKNPDGSISTVRSISINEDGREILIPTVSDDGRILTDAQAVELYHRTGKHLGMFSDEASATRYAQQLHESEAAKLVPDTFEERQRRFEQRMAELGHPVVMTSGRRTPEEQARLYAQGRSTAGPVVTDTLQSKHLTGDAADYAFLVNGKPSYGEDLPWGLLGKTAKESGFEWGGDWKKPDRPHVQMGGSTPMTTPTSSGPDSLTLDQVQHILQAMEERGASPDEMRTAATEMKARVKADTFGPGEHTTVATPGYFSRVGESLKENYEGLKTLAKAVTGNLDPQTGQAVAKGLMDMPKEAVAHPLKTAVRMVGGNPEKMWQDYMSGNIPALAGDVTVPIAGALAPKVVPKVVAGAGGATRAAARTVGAASEIAEGSPLLKFAVGSKGAAALNVGGRLLRRYGRDTEPILPDTPVGSGIPRPNLAEPGPLTAEVPEAPPRPIVPDPSSGSGVPSAVRLAPPGPLTAEVPSRPKITPDPSSGSGTPPASMPPAPGPLTATVPDRLQPTPISGSGLPSAVRLVPPPPPEAVPTPAVHEVPWEVPEGLSQKLDTEHPDLMRRLESGDFEIQKVTPDPSWKAVQTQGPVASGDFPPIPFDKTTGSQGFKNVATAPPTVLLTDEGTVIMQGHHRLRQAMQDGEPIDAAVVDLRKDAVLNRQRQQAHISDHYANQPSPFRQNLWDPPNEGPQSLEEFIAIDALQKRRGL